MRDDRLKPVLEDILKAIHWKTFTKGQRTKVAEIVLDFDMDSMAKANLICEFLQIQKRDNRQAIYKVIFQSIYC